ncbi:MAG: bifunctional metallophosphatase/5'-nucleotidase [Bacteroidales bacterium]|nr:bifunctional metallophosphatase/5'-nucleotidase [Bacteroidales bacterium]
MKHLTITLLAIAALLSAACRPHTGSVHVITTNDVHGAWFDSTYVGGRQVPSLFAVNYYVDSIRSAVGKDKVLLLDAGDCLQGDNAAYYYNYVDTLGEHLFVRLADYMGYDAIVVGNHDVETGHHVYDRVTPQLARRGIPFLAGNALKADGKPYWPEYKVFRKGGLKVLVLGYTNANMAAWLDESIWSGIKFVSLVPFVQERVDALKAKIKPDVTIVAVHSGVGAGDGEVLEAQGLDLFKTLRGVDLVVTSHDHRQRMESADSIALVNTGSKANNFSHTVITLNPDGSKTIAPAIVRVDKTKADPKMRAAFAGDFAEVRQFTTMQVGSISEPMLTRESFAGRCFYIDFIHFIERRFSGADISFAAPLSYNKEVPAGTIVFNDLFTIYPFENTLCVLKLTGREIKDYLEFSYGRWIQTWKPGGHVFNMTQRDDPRYFQSRWSFNYASYNFDSASGINYTVDITKPFGSRVRIVSMADGSAFEPDREYTVAMTSYRAAGGGDLLFQGAGLTREELDGRLVARYPEIRDLIYRYFTIHDIADPALFEEQLEDMDDTRFLLGDWRFIPESIANKAISADMNLMFGNL